MQPISLIHRLESAIIAVQTYDGCSSACQSIYRHVEMIIFWIPLKLSLVFAYLGK